MLSSVPYLSLLESPIANMLSTTLCGQQKETTYSYCFQRFLYKALGLLELAGDVVGRCLALQKQIVHTRTQKLNSARNEHYMARSEERNHLILH